MITYLFDALVIKAAGNIVRFRTKSPIVTLCSIQCIIKLLTGYFYCSLLLESDLDRALIGNEKLT